MIYIQGRVEHIPTALLSMMPWALVLAADMAAGSVAKEPKNLRRNDVVGSELMQLYSRASFGYYCRLSGNLAAFLDSVRSAVGLR